LKIEIKSLEVVKVNKPMTSAFAQPNIGSRQSEMRPVVVVPAICSRYWKLNFSVSNLQSQPRYT